MHAPDRVLCAYGATPVGPFFFDADLGDEIENAGEVGRPPLENLWQGVNAGDLVLRVVDGTRQVQHASPGRHMVVAGHV